MPLIWITWLRSGAIPLDGYGFKIRKISRCRPTISNGTTLATKKEFFFTKVAPVQSITDIVLLGFLLILLSFISPNTTIYFFVKNQFFFWMFIFQWIRYSNVVICFFRWEIGHPLSTYPQLEEWRGVIQNVCRCVLGERGITPHLYVRTYAHLIFLLSYDVLKHALSYVVLFYL